MDEAWEAWRLWHVIQQFSDELWARYEKEFVRFFSNEGEENERYDAKTSDLPF